MQWHQLRENYKEQQLHGAGRLSLDRSLKVLSRQRGVCVGSLARTLLLSSHGATQPQPPPRGFPYPRDEMRLCSESASPLCHRSLPALSKTLWARLQGAELSLCLLAAGRMCQRVWEASSHCSVPAPEGIGGPCTARAPRAPRSRLASLGQGQGELEVL